MLTKNGFTWYIINRVATVSVVDQPAVNNGVSSIILQDGDSNKSIRTDWLGIGLNSSIPEV